MKKNSKLEFLKLSDFLRNKIFDEFRYKYCQDYRDLKDWDKFTKQFVADMQQWCDSGLSLVEALLTVIDEREDRHQEEWKKKVG